MVMVIVMLLMDTAMGTNMVVPIASAVATH